MGTAARLLGHSLAQTSQTISKTTVVIGSRNPVVESSKSFNAGEIVSVRQPRVHPTVVIYDLAVASLYLLTRFAIHQLRR